MPPPPKPEPAPSLPYGGGGAPTIPRRQVGSPGIVEIGDQCTGPEFNYLKKLKDPVVLKQGHNPKKRPGRPSKSQQLVTESMREVFSHPPSTLGTDQTQEERRKQMVAIGMSKARARGAKV